MIGERGILDSWKEISDFLKRDIRTCQRYERELGMPVRRLEGSSRARVFAYKDEIDAWQSKRLVGHSKILPRLFYYLSAKPLAAFPLLILIIGSGAALGHFITQRRDPKTSHAPLTIAVLPFQNCSGQPDLDKWALGVPQLLVQGLSGSKYFIVLGDDRTAGSLRDLGIDPAKPYADDDLARMGKKSGATHAVMGLIIKAGDGLVITLTTEEIGADQVYSSRFECADESTIF